MGLCGNAFEKLGSMLGNTFSKPQVRTIKATAKCPGCGKEFEVEVKVSQTVAGSVLDFNASPGSGLSGLCPWSHG